MTSISSNLTYPDAHSAINPTELTQPKPVHPIVTRLIEEDVFPMDKAPFTTEDIAELGNSIHRPSSRCESPRTFNFEWNENTPPYLRTFTEFPSPSEDIAVSVRGFLKNQGNFDVMEESIIYDLFLRLFPSCKKCTTNSQSMSFEVETDDYNLWAVLYRKMSSNEQKTIFSQFKVTIRVAPSVSTFTFKVDAVAQERLKLSQLKKVPTQMFFPPEEHSSQEELQQRGRLTSFYQRTCANKLSVNPMDPEDFT
jgi:hypothetical protein